MKYICLCFVLFLSGCGGESDYSYKLDLSGDWNFCKIDASFNYPEGLSSCTWNSVVLPDTQLFNTLNADAEGYYIFRKFFAIDVVPEKDLLFQAGEIMNAERVYLNGIYFGRSGKFPPDFKSAWAKFRSYTVPENFLKTGDNTLDIMLYYNAELWITRPLQIVDAESGKITSMIRDFWQIQFMHAFALLLLSLGGFFLLIYVKRNSEKEYLYFALCCLFLADMVTLQYLENLYPDLPVSSNVIFQINQSGLILFPPMLAFFFRSYMGWWISPKRILIYMILPVATVIAMILSDDRAGIMYWRNIFLLIIPFYILDVIIVSARRLLSGNREGMLMIVGIFPILLFGIHDVLMFTFHFFQDSIPLYIFGVPVMISVIAVQLVNRFINSLNMTEKLNLILENKIEEGKRLASLDKELSIARKIQLAAVPKTLPDHPGFSIHVKYVPAENISGDFYNFHTLNSDGIGVMVADVSGHGVPASLIASMVKILFSVLAPVAADPVMFLQGINSYLFNKMEDNFLTAGYCFFNSRTMTGQYARAGHEPLIHITKIDGSPVINRYMPAGRAVGIIKEIDVEYAVFKFNSGDRFVLYTDCIIEEINSSNSMFGVEGLEKVLMESIDKDAVRCTEHVFASLKEWSLERHQHNFEDDFTLIVIDIV